MRGYDPAEVDRHLETISQMISTGTLAELAREQEERLAQREAAIAAQEAEAKRLTEDAARELTAARTEADATIEGAKAKARAIEQEAAATLDEARLQAQASEILEDAQRQAAEITGQAQADLERARTEGMKAVEAEVEEYVARRRREADRIVEAAREEKRGG